MTNLKTSSDKIRKVLIFWFKLMILLDYLFEIERRLSEPHPLIQVLLGPRQVGKTTTIEQIIARRPSDAKHHYASAEAVFRSDWSWIERQWQIATALGPKTLLVIDEIQKIENWSEMIKKLWDANRSSPSCPKVILLGSSSLALQTGLSESLTGRFELVRAYHWNFHETSDAFNMSLEEFLVYGGYPGADQFRKDPIRWLHYIRSSIIETVIDKDITQLRRVAKPALFKQVFELLCSFPAMEISLRKLVGQLQDPGSVETVKHYIELLEGAFLVKTLQKFSTNTLQRKSSSPKVLPLCPALCTFARGEVAASTDQRGRLFELAVGLDLLRLPGQLFYWRLDQVEVDYVYKAGSKLFAIEVKSGRRKSPHGLAKFKEQFSHAKCAVMTPENYFQFSKSPMETLIQYSY